MGKLLQLIAKLFGKNAISKTLGTRTNVIKLPGNEQKRLIKDELNIEAASDLAAQKLLKEAEDLIAEIPKMNDQEILTLTGNLQRLDNKLNPPSAEVLDLTTKKPITGEGLEQLAARDGLPADVSPDSPIGKVMQGAQRLRKEKEELDRMLKDPVKQLEQEMQNPYRAGGALDPKMGIVRTAARQVLQKLAREGKINIEDQREAKAIIEGYQGGVDPIEVFRKTFGQDALGDLANLGDELLEIDNRGGSFKELKKILDDEGFFDLQQPKSPAQGMTDEELMKRIKDEDPEEFATGGRVGFDDGGILSLEEAKKLNPGMFVDTTTYNPIPENAPNMAADEIAKVIMGTLGMDDDMSSRTFVFEEYVVPKRKELMENFGLTMKEADDLIREGIAKYRTNKAIGGRVGFQKGTSKIFDQLEMNVPYPYGHRVNYQIGGPAYDATDASIYGSSAITVTPDTIMGPGGNQIQDKMGKPGIISPITGMPVPPGGYEKIGGPYIPPPGIDLPGNLGTPMGPPAHNLIPAPPNRPPVYGPGGVTLRPGKPPEEIDLPNLGRNNNVGGFLPVMPKDMRYRDPGVPGIGPGGKLEPFKGETFNQIPEQYRSGFAEYVKQNPIGIGGQAVSFARLPDGNQVQFGDTASAGAFRNYLKSIGVETPNSVPQLAIQQPLIDTKSILQDYGNSDFFSRISTADVRPFTFGGKEMSGSSTYIGGLTNYLDSIGKSDLLQLPEPQTSSLQKQQPFSPLAATAYFSKGGRVGYAYGSGLKLAQLLQKAGKSLKQAIKEAVDNINPTGDKKLDADMAVDDMLETYSIDKDAVDGYDILNAYDEAYKTITNPKTISEVETLEAMGANITAKTLELVEKYPGLNSDLARKIASDPDPQRQAEVISTIEQAFELMKQGKSSDEVLDIMKQMTDRTKQAGGGLSYLSGF
jgi:hypothetical protein